MLWWDECIPLQYCLLHPFHWNRFQCHLGPHNKLFEVRRGDEWQIRVVAAALHPTRKQKATNEKYILHKCVMELRVVVFGLRVAGPAPWMILFCDAAPPRPRVLPRRPPLDGFLVRTYVNCASERQWILESNLKASLE